MMIRAGPKLAIKNDAWSAARGTNASRGRLELEVKFMFAADPSAVSTSASRGRLEFEWDLLPTPAALNQECHLTAPVRAGHGLAKIFAAQHLF